MTGGAAQFHCIFLRRYLRAARDLAPHWCGLGWRSPHEQEIQREKLPGHREVRSNRRTNKYIMFYHHHPSPPSSSDCRNIPAVIVSSLSNKAPISYLLAAPCQGNLRISSDGEEDREYNKYQTLPLCFPVNAIPSSSVPPYNWTNVFCRANSVTWNPHKLMGTLLQCSTLHIKETVSWEVLIEGLEYFF